MFYMTTRLLKHNRVHHVPTRKEIVAKVEKTYREYKQAEDTFNKTRGANQPELARTFWRWHNAIQELTKHDSRLLK